MQQYILVINGKPEGPFSVEQLKGMAIKPGDFVKTPEMIDYKEVHESEELRQRFHFQKRTVVPQYFAAFDQRLLASALDWFFIAGFYIIIGFTAIILITDRETRLVIAFSLLALIPLTNFIYHVIMESSPRQATYGKQILRIKVCDMEGKRIGMGMAIGRNLLKIFSLMSVVGYLLSFFTKYQQCLHDMMAGTLVMKDRLI
ncbi:MAG: RDD family protein [Mucilaginibacter sp.]